MISKLRILAASLEGELHRDKMMRTLYATDASVYREMPLAVAYPKHKEDVQQIVHFARQHGLSLIPRAAGTSLAGQCVGDGIVLDCSLFMRDILEVNKEEGWVRVQPGVIRDDLNHFLKKHGLFFGPNTSTANRAMIGGMVGNNSCGSYSIVYGSTREHTMEVKAILADGSEATFGAMNRESFEEKSRQPGLEGELYRSLIKILQNTDNQSSIKNEFPKYGIPRRNTGYALDLLLDSKRFDRKGEDFNFCKLIAGSEGTLCFLTEIKLHCDPLPPSHKGLMCVHFESVDASLPAVVSIMKHQPRACELMDKIVMDCTLENRLYEPYRFFIEGDPGAILIIEFGAESRAEVEAAFDKLEADLRAQNMGISFPRIWKAKDIEKVWNLRKAGLGLLSNIPGDAKPVAVIEDTAVLVEDLPAYIHEFRAIMDEIGQDAVYYAHAGAGELHLRPILNLKDKKDRKLFRDIAEKTATLVKRYGGSLSGEHGDGRVRAEFVEQMVGKNNYKLFQEIKNTWDENNIFNPGKIVNAVRMDEQLRYEEDAETPQFDTAFNFDDTDGILRMAEKCNGSGDCRKSHLGGGTMCPSFMASRREKDTTRARANMLREMLTQSSKENKFDHQELKEVMDLCLSCKGCASECPSNVDMASLKAEFLHQYFKTHGIPFRSMVFAKFETLSKLAAPLQEISNFFLRGPFSGLTKRILGIHPQRSMPPLHRNTWRKWWRKEGKALAVNGEIKGSIYLFCDEFTNFNEPHIGIAAVKLLKHLGYDVKMIEHPESGRAALSKGVLKKAAAVAEENVSIFGNIISTDIPLVGIEPSCILGFRDEYPRLVSSDKIDAAKSLSKNCFIIEEFLSKEIQKGNITEKLFSTESKEILLHGHCHQKALSSTAPTIEILSLPTHFSVKEIPSGCCGMAGSFGYEKEHYELSMQVGELVLFPAVRAAKSDTTLAAPGTSCRHQIYDGTGGKALHPVEILWEAVL